jgi:hypothetical protein
MLMDPSYLAHPPLVPIEEDLGSAGNWVCAPEQGREVALCRSRICWHDALAGQASPLVERYQPVADVQRNATSPAPPERESTL